MSILLQAVLLSLLISIGAYQLVAMVMTTPLTVYQYQPISVLATQRAAAASLFVQEEDVLSGVISDDEHILVKPGTLVCRGSGFLAARAL